MAPPETPQKGIAHRALRVLVAVAGVATLVVAGAVVLLVAGALALSQGWQREWLREIVEGQLAVALEAEVVVGALEGPLYPELTLRDVELQRPGVDARLRALRLRLSLARVWSERRIDLVEISALEPSAQVDLDIVGAAPAGTGLDPEGATESGRAPLPVSVTVGRIAVSQGRIALRGTREGRPFEAQGSFDLEAPGPTLDTQGRLLWPDTAAASVRAQLTGGLGEARIEGQIELDRIAALDVDARGIELAELVRLIPALPALGGVAEVRARLVGPWNALGGEARVSVERLSVQGHAVGDLHAHVSSEETTPGESGVFTLSNLELVRPEISIRSEGAARIRTGEPWTIDDGTFETIKAASRGRSRHSRSCPTQGRFEWTGASRPTGWSRCSFAPTGSTWSDGPRCGPCPSPWEERYRLGSRPTAPFPSRDSRGRPPGPDPAWTRSPPTSSRSREACEETPCRWQSRSAAPEASG